jgi:hypothetical protein
MSDLRDMVSEMVVGTLGLLATFALLAWVSVLPTIGLLWLFGWLA